MFSHCASGVKNAWRDSNLLQEGERWLQVLGAVLCNQDSGIAIQAVTPASKEELGTLLPLGRRFQYLWALTKSMFVGPLLPSRPHRRDISPSLPQGPQRSCQDFCTNHTPLTSVSLHSGGKQQSPHICTRVQTPEELPKEEEARKENCGNHQHPSSAQQIKGFLVAKQV